MKRVAIPVAGGKLTEFCGNCNNYEVYLTDGVNILGRETLMPPGDNNISLPEWASGNGITDLIVNKVDKEIINYFAGYKINLFVGIPLKKTRTLMKDFLNGSLKSDTRIIDEIYKGQ